MAEPIARRIMPPHFVFFIEDSTSSPSLGEKSRDITAPQTASARAVCRRGGRAVADRRGEGRGEIRDERRRGPRQAADVRYVGP